MNSFFASPERSSNNDLQQEIERVSKNSVIDGLLFLQDVTRQQKLAAMEKVFFHDINNMLTGLLGASQLLAIKNKESIEADKVHQMALRLAQEITIQSGKVEFTSSQDQGTTFCFSLPLG